MTEDLYIKAMSYAYLNKTFFFLSVVFAIIVLIWPSFVAFWKNDETEAVVLQTLKTMQKQGQEKGGKNASLSMQDEAAEKITAIKERGTIGRLLSRLVGVAGMQTTVTALAALSFAFYAHYKDNQTTSEGLMRTVIFAEKLNEELLGEVIAQMLEMDRGFGFAEALPSIARANEASSQNVQGANGQPEGN